MRLENSFRIGLPVAGAWATLLDIPAVARCMPGAELLAVEDERTYLGQVKVKLGPVAVAFKGRARLVELDEERRIVRVNATGTEAKGRGSAQADVAFHLSPDAQGTRVDISTDLLLAGAVAQYGRAQGVIADVSQVMVDAFAQNLCAHIASRAAPSASSDVRPGETLPVAPALSVFALIGAPIRRWFARLRKEPSS